MKKAFIIIAAALCLCAGANAASKRTSGVQGEASFVFAGAQHWVLGGRATVGYQFGKDLFIGVGSGLISTLNPDGNDANYVPIYADGRWYLQDKKNSLFLNLSAGYAAATTIGTTGGAYVAPMIGYNFETKGRLSFDLGLGYLYQGIKHWGQPFSQHSPEIRLGVRF